MNNRQHMREALKIPPAPAFVRLWQSTERAAPPPRLRGRLGNSPPARHANRRGRHQGRLRRPLRIPEVEPKDLDNITVSRVSVRLEHGGSRTTPSPTCRSHPRRSAVRRRQRRTAALPAVPVENGWSGAEFLSRAPAGKAKLSPDCLEDDDTMVTLIEGQVFREAPDGRRRRGACNGRNRLFFSVSRSSAP
ncbi:hypothetical protein DJ82_00555 [Halorubrum sp. Ib24]|uniref:AMMECR1 domain-containing protein n=1 Tax=Halorubrum sp. Ib24 TaxID=1383850 RepID=UPI000B997258|nr:hypothetical protein DJ82_00555 [Halorubrum sp. Ib24]